MTRTQAAVYLLGAVTGSDTTAYLLVRSAAPFQLGLSAVGTPAAPEHPRFAGVRRASP